MDKTKTFTFTNVNNFKKKFKKIESKIKDKETRITLNFIDLNAEVKIKNDHNLYICKGDDWFGFMRIMDVFELIIYVKTENGSEECYIIKYKDVA